MMFSTMNMISEVTSHIFELILFCITAIRNMKIFCSCSNYSNVLFTRSNTLQKAIKIQYSKFTMFLTLLFFKS